MIRERLAAAVVAVLLAGCAVRPEYRQPQVPLPARYYRAPSGEAAASITDLPWWQVFDDPKLVALVQEALHDNVDLRITARRSRKRRRNWRWRARRSFRR